MTAMGRQDFRVLARSRGARTGSPGSPGRSNTHRTSACRGAHGRIVASPFAHARLKKRFWTRAPRGDGRLVHHLRRYPATCCTTSGSSPSRKRCTRTATCCRQGPAYGPRRSAAVAAGDRRAGEPRRPRGQGRIRAAGRLSPIRSRHASRGQPLYDVIRHGEKEIPIHKQRRLRTQGDEAMSTGPLQKPDVIVGGPSRTPKITTPSSSRRPPSGRPSGRRPDACGRRRQSIHQCPSSPARQTLRIPWQDRTCGECPSAARSARRSR